MTQDDPDKRNFLFFLNEINPLNSGDALIGALAAPSSWDAVAGMVKSARQKDTFARSIKKLQLYVHVPFCGKLCTFCSCAKVLLRRRLDIDAYVKALSRQMTLFAPVYQGMDAASILFGGGTPSLLDEKQMTAVLDAADRAFPASRRKIFFEVNPSSWTASKLAVLSGRGLTRLSIGVQTLDEKVLKRVTRPQSRKKVLWCLRSARKAGVPQVNVDFIAGLPGQTIKGLIQDIKVVINEGVNIISVEPYHTLPLMEMCGPGETVPVFFKRRDAMMKASVEVLKEAGFRRQGIFGIYTRDGQSDESHYEEAYSRLEEAVAGFGPSARGQFPGTVLYRAGMLRSPAELPTVNICAQDLDYAMSHYAVFALLVGLDEQVFMKRFGVPLEKHCGEGLRYLQQSGLASFSKGKWKYSGPWEIRQIREFAALSRVLFGEDILSRLRERYIRQYDPKRDYSKDNSIIKAYADDFLMTLYYKGNVN